MKIGIDLDGTVYRSTTIINNAKQALVDIGQDHEIYYLTNNSSKSPEQLVKKLSMLSDIAIATDKFVTPLLVSIGSFRWYSSTPSESYSKLDHNECMLSMYMTIFSMV